MWHAFKTKKNYENILIYCYIITWMYMHKPVVYVYVYVVYAVQRFMAIRVILYVPRFE